MESYNANKIKKELKEAGIKTSKISIRCTYSSINITIKDPSISCSKVEEIVRNKYEKIDRCEYSGEILSGGNTFVFCGYDWELRREETKKLDAMSNQLVLLAKNTYTGIASLKRVANKLAHDGVSFIGFSAEFTEEVLCSLLYPYAKEIDVSVH